jgi:hypothetical protein
MQIPKPMTRMHIETLIDVVGSIMVLGMYQLIIKLAKRTRLINRVPLQLLISPYITRTKGSKNVIISCNPTCYYSFVFLGIL